MKVFQMKLLFLLALAFFACSQVCAQMLPVTTFDSLEWKTADSDLVVVGRVMTIHRDDKETVTLHVDETIKGPPIKDLTFALLTDWPIQKPDRWDTNDSLLVFFVESRRIGPGMMSDTRRFLSRYRYTPRLGGDFTSPDYAAGARIALVPGEKRRIYSAAGAHLNDPDAILAIVRAAAAATKGGRYQADKIAIASPYHLFVPKPAPPPTNWGSDEPARFDSTAEFDGARILAGRGSAACLWDAESGHIIKQFEGKAGDIQAVAFSPDGEEVVTGSGARPGPLSGAVLLWSIETGKVEKEFGKPRAAVNGIDFGARTGSILTTWGTYGSQGPLQTVWNAFSQEATFVIPGEGARFSPDSTLFASFNGERSYNGTWAGVWDARTHQQICTLEGGSEVQRIFHSVDLCAYGDRLVTSSTEGVEVWDVNTGKHLLNLKAGRAWDAHYTPDGLYILAAMPTPVVNMWDAETGEAVRQFNCPARPHGMILSPDGKRLLVKWSTGPYFDSRAEGASLFNFDDGKELLQIKGDVSGLIGFSPDSKTICAIDPGRTAGTIWDAESGKVLRSIHLE